MDYKYTFVGVVLPERAQMSLGFNHGIHLHDGGEGHIDCSVINNQLLAVIKLTSDIDTMTLRNMTYQMIQNHFSALGFYTGHYYDVKLERVFNDDFTINYVYGIENKDVKDFWGDIDIHALMNEYTSKVTGNPGIFINRCLGDLMSALKNVEDAGFFCYRAIETLRNHNSLCQGLLDEKEGKQWECFRIKANCDRAEIDEIKKYADDLRHGRPVVLSAPEVKDILINTWGIVKKYMENI